MSGNSAKLSVKDKVQIREGAFSVRRVGYKLHYHDVTDEQLYAFFGQHLKEIMLQSSDLPYYNYVIEGYRKAYVAAHDFGGPERTVHFDEWLGPHKTTKVIYTVKKLYRKQTGVRTLTYYDYAYDSVGQPYLSNIKVVQIAKLSNGREYLVEDLIRV